MRVTVQGSAPNNLLNDGVGNPKQTKSLLLAHRTPPAMLSGIRPRAETAMRAGLKFIQFAVRPEPEAAAIDAFLSALRPLSSPWLEDGRPYDTPALIELWRTAPYLVDGRAATLAEVVGVHNPGDRHGRTSALTAPERADLVAFLRSR